MATRLPEELLREVLSIGLHVPEQAFADSGPTSPFRLVVRSSSDFLLVSKLWMRIATPELYRTVVLRSFAQARQLSLALKSNPALGRHIRQLRIEGAYGDAIRQIATKCPFVADICLSLRVWSHENASGLATALSQLTPTRVVLTLAPEKLPSNRQHDELLRALSKSIRSWTSLRAFKFAGSQIRDPDGPQRPDFLLYRSIMDALQVARSLEEVSLSLGPGLYYTRNNDLMTEAARAVESLLRAHSTVRVTFYRIDLILDGSQSHNHDVDITEDEDTILRSNIAASFHSRLMRVAPRISTPVSSEPGLAKSGIRPFNRSYASLEQSERGAIFSRIVRYAIEIPRGGYVRQESQEGTWVHLDGIDLQTAFALQMTSRDVKFYALAILAQRIHLTRKSHLPSLMRLLDEHPSLASSIRDIRFGMNIPALAQANILTRATGLKSVQGVATYCALPSLIVAQGLRELGIVSHKSTRLGFTLPLQHFSVLASLTIDVDDRFHVIEEHNNWELSINCLETLTVESCPQSILEVLQRAMLPKLETLDVRSLKGCRIDALIRSLGRNLQHVLVLDIPPSIWTTTPRLTELDVFDEFRFDTSIARAFDAADHSTLRRLRFHCSLSRLPLNGTSRKVVFQELMAHLSCEKFRTLGAVQLCSGFNLWPLDAHSQRSNMWPAQAQRLARQGIRLLDAKGTEWHKISK